MDLQARLGHPVAPGPALSPLPIRHRTLYAGSLFLGLGIVVPQVWGWLTEPAARYLSPQILFFYFLPALLLAVYGGLNVYREYSRQWEPALFENGISLRRGSQLVAFRFDEVREASLQERELLANGRIVATQREVALRSDAARAVLRLRTLQGEEDQAAAFLDQLRAVLLGVAGAVSFGLAAWLFLEEGGLSSWAMTGIVCGVALAAAAYLMAARGFRCYEHGLVKFSPLGEQELRFSEVRGVGSRTSPLYYKNIYIGTTYSMTFRREGDRPFEVSAHSRHAADPDLERLRDRLTRQIAEARG